MAKSITRRDFLNGATLAKAAAEIFDDAVRGGAYPLLRLEKVL
jgi:hypothetical protein